MQWHRPGGDESGVVGSAGHAHESRCPPRSPWFVMHLSCHPLFDNPELPLAGLTHPRKSNGGVAGAAMFIACPTLGCIFWASFGSLGSLTIAMKSHVVSCLGLGTLQFCRVLNPYDIAVEKLSCHAMSLGGTHMTDHLHANNPPSERGRSTNETAYVFELRTLLLVPASSGRHDGVGRQGEPVT